MIVIADASALVALAICDCLNILEPLFEEVMVPQAVFEEVTIPGKPASDKLKKYLHNKIENFDSNMIVIDGNSIDKGELMSMALYKAVKADYLLIDEKLGRKIARLNNINIIGSLGVLIEARRKGLSKNIKPHVETLRTSKIYFSSTLLDHALKITNEYN